MTEVFGRPPPREEPGAKMSWRIFVRFLVAENALGDLEQLPELDESRHPARSGAWKVSSPTQRKRTAPSRVSSATPSK